MKYAFALAAIAGMAAAQPHVGHAHLHKKAMETVTDWTVVTVTDVVTVYGPSPVSQPTQAPPAPPAPASSKAAAPPAPPAPASSKPAVSAPAPAPPASSQVFLQQSSAAQPKPVQPTSAAAAPPAPAQSSPAPAQSSPASSGGSGGSLGGDVQHGDMTLYDIAGGTTSCGNSGGDDTVAMTSKIMTPKNGNNPNHNPLCGKKIQIKNPKTGATAVGTIQDTCPGCSGDAGIDLVPALWAKLNNNGPGDRVPVEWSYL